jgi:hypothetical protein
MTDEIENWVQAAQNNEYAEFELEDGIMLITRWLDSYEFKPFITVPEEFDHRDKLDNLVEEEVGEFVNFDELQEYGDRTFDLVGVELNIDDS